MLYVNRFLGLKSNYYLLYNNYIRGFGSFTKNVELTIRGANNEVALIFAVTVTATLRRLLFNPVTLKNVLTVVVTALPSIGGGDIDTS